jgi:hypothetical protein
MAWKRPAVPIGRGGWCGLGSLRRQRQAGAPMVNARVIAMEIVGWAFEAVGG